jgi:hypothetical protein
LLLRPSALEEFEIYYILKASKKYFTVQKKKKTMEQRCFEQFLNGKFNCHSVPHPFLCMCAYDFFLSQKLDRVGQTWFPERREGSVQSPPGSCELQPRKP